MTHSSDPIRNPQPAVINPASPESVDPAEEMPPPHTRVRTGGSARAIRQQSLLTVDGRLTSGRLAGLTMWSAILTLSWPVVADSLLNSLVGLTDTVLAAQISEAATDAIGGASYLLWFVGLVIMALDVGAAALVARSVGAGRLAVANAALAQVILMGLLAGFVVGGLMALCAGPAAGLLSLRSEDATSAFQSYMLWNAAGVPFMGVLFAGLACARGAGDTLRPLGIMVIVNIVNMIGSWVLAGTDFTTTHMSGGERVTTTILENPFSFDLGVTGIAIGTVLGHAVGAVLVITLTWRGWAGLQLHARRLRPHWHTSRRILRIGFANFLETFGMWICNYAVIVAVGLLSRAEGGGGLLGAHIMAIRIEAFSYLPGIAMGAAAATLAGQYLGAGAPTLARKAVWRCTIVAMCTMGLSGAAFILVPASLVGLFTSQDAHLDTSPILLFITGWVQVPFAISIVLRSAMRGAGDVKVVMWLTWLTQYAVRLPAVYILSGVDIPLPEFVGGGVLENPSPFQAGLAGVWLALCGEVVIRAIVFAARFKHGGWLRCEV